MNPKALNAFLVIALFLFSCPLYSEIPADTLTDHRAEIFNLQGHVKILKAGVAEVAQKGMIVEMGDQIITGEDSYVEVVYDEHFLNIARIDANTKAEFRNIEPTDLHLEDGSVFSALDGLKQGSQYSVSTPTAVAAVRGTHFDVMFDSNTGVTDAAVIPDQKEHISQLEITPLLEGGAAGEPVLIQEGQQVDVQGGEPLNPEPASPERIEEAAGMLGEMMENVDPSLRQEGESLLEVGPTDNGEPLDEGEKEEGESKKEDGDSKPAGDGNPPNGDHQDSSAEGSDPKEDVGPLMLKQEGNNQDGFEEGKKSDFDKNPEDKNPDLPVTLQDSDKDGESNLLESPAETPNDEKGNEPFTLKEENRSDLPAPLQDSDKDGESNLLEGSAPAVPDAPIQNKEAEIDAFVDALIPTEETTQLTETQGQDAEVRVRSSNGDQNQEEEQNQEGNQGEQKGLEGPKDFRGPEGEFKGPMPGGAMEGEPFGLHSGGDATDQGPRFDFGQMMEFFNTGGAFEFNPDQMDPNAMGPNMDLNMQGIFDSLGFDQEFSARMGDNFEKMMDSMYLRFSEPGPEGEMALGAPGPGVMPEGNMPMDPNLMSSMGNMPQFGEHSEFDQFFGVEGTGSPNGMMEGMMGGMMMDGMGGMMPEGGIDPAMMSAFFDSAVAGNFFDPSEFAHQATEDHIFFNPNDFQNLPPDLLALFLGERNFHILQTVNKIEHLAHEHSFLDHELVNGVGYNLPGPITNVNPNDPDMLVKVTDIVRDEGQPNTAQVNFEIHDNGNIVQSGSVVCTEATCAGI